ncbi:uncharacterized protein LOC118830634 isoform X2 [Trichosurus vulpecula]|uniref:uncharacterized protein LOC118830634 isoform X2 n=1 Tax=Trichosurus vulpecula TaxID=9337 RepID=UPI00186ACB1A|nr:uncharacterized protein LOC118830634 isoform X2 [Trichosurus vulpecula]
MSQEEAAACRAVSPDLSRPPRTPAMAAGTEKDGNGESLMAPRRTPSLPGSPDLAEPGKPLCPHPGGGLGAEGQDSSGSPEYPLIIRTKKLVLHMDINNTILVADSATGQGLMAALNSYLSTVCWGQFNQEGEWQWLSEFPSLLPPSPDASSFSTNFGRHTEFTSSALGHPFQTLFSHYLQLLEWPGQPDAVFSVLGEDGRHYHRVLPAFFKLLAGLCQQGRRFAVIFRTFGKDLTSLLQTTHKALQGQHPQFSALKEVVLPVDLRPGKIRCSPKKVMVSRGKESVSSWPDARVVYDYFSAMEGLGGFQDHFDWWAKNNFSSQGGKPLWVDPHDPDVQHICFDDNVRLQDEESIFHPQVFMGQGRQECCTVPTSELYSICLVQNDLLQAIANPDYFLMTVSQCEDRYDQYLAKAQTDHSC